MTGPHRLPGSSPPAPWGTFHVKLVGTHATVCGLPSIGWHAFWAVAFAPRSEAACRACARGLWEATTQPRS